MKTTQQLSFDDVMTKKGKPYKNLEQVDTEHIREVLKEHKVTVAKLAKIEGMPVSEGALRMQIRRGQMNVTAVSLIADYLGISAANLIRKESEILELRISFFPVEKGGERLSLSAMEKIRDALTHYMEMESYLHLEEYGWYSSIYGDDDVFDEE